MGNEAVLGKLLLVRLGSALPLWGLLDLRCHSRTWDKCFHIGLCICWSNENHKGFIPQVMFSFRPSLTKAGPDTSFGWFGFFLTQTYSVFCLSKQQYIRKLLGHIPRSGVLIAYLPDSVVHFLTCMPFLSLHFYSYFLTLSSVLRSVVHFRNVAKMEHILPVPKRVWKWKKYNFSVIFWLFNTDC